MLLRADLLESGETWTSAVRHRCAVLTPPDILQGSNPQDEPSIAHLGVSSSVMKTKMEVKALLESKKRFLTKGARIAEKRSFPDSLSGIYAFFEASHAFVQADEVGDVFDQLKGVLMTDAFKKYDSRCKS